MFFYYLIFFFIVLMLLVSLGPAINRNVYLFIIAVVLILVAGLKPIGLDMDSITYVNVFNEINSPVDYFRNYNYNYFFEPAYYLIPSVVINYLNWDVFWVFLIFAALGISLKLIAISRLTDFVFLSVLVYYCHFYFLHELTQIRAGVASSLLLLCIIEIQRRNLLTFLLLVGVGILFHYSFIIFLPFYFLSSTFINKKFYLALLFAPYILVAFDLNIITLFQIFKLGVISEKIEKYNDLLSFGIYDTIKTYSAVFMVQLAICVLFLFKSDLLLQNNKYALLLLKIYCIAGACLVLFSNIPVLAIRISEMLNIVQIVLIPFLLYVVKPKNIAVALVFIFALVYMSINLFYLPILKPYFGNSFVWE